MRSSLVMKKSIILLLLAAIAATSCRKPYDPPAISKPNGYLVVEGVINSGADSTYIELSRTINISSSAQISPELHAIVSVQGDQNTSYPLTERGNGKYSCAGLNLDNTHQYRLSIKTTDNKQYQSAYMPVLNSPPIDSVSWDTKGALTVPGVNIYVNTHDPSGKVLYYRWTYNETWAFHANFGSCCYTNGDTILPRNAKMDITDCWQSDTSSNIILGSSAKLSKDVILKAPVTQVVSTAEKLETTYSILVTQYALTPDAYNFYTNVRLTSQSLGSIFDAEPSQINGNITCVSNPSEPVIGYIGVGATSTQRIFIANGQLPSWVAIPFYPGCTLFYILGPGGTPQLCCLYNDYGFNEVNEYINYLSSGFFSGTTSLPLIPVAPMGPPGQPPTGYTATEKQCADCTLRGSNKKPSFWP